MTTERTSPPRDNLVRAILPGAEFRAADPEATDGRLGTLIGHFATFNQPTTIDSVFEGKFREQIAPGAFKKTFAENRSQMKVTLNHGKDPQAGDKPLGPIDVLEEDSTGAYYEVPLLDTSYNRDILPGLKAGLYGASFRFQVVKDDFNTKAPRSATNPDGLPERTIREAKVMEFGPVTFPAYSSATAGVRSLTDSYILERFTSDPERLVRSLDDLATYLLADKAALQTAIDKLGNGDPLLVQEAEMLEAAIEHLEPPEAAEDDEMNALPKVGAEATHSAPESREPVAVAPAPAPVRATKKTTPKENRKVDLSQYHNTDEMVSAEVELRDEITALGAIFPLPESRQAEWDQLIEDQKALKRAIAFRRDQEHTLIELDRTKPDDNVIEADARPARDYSGRNQIIDRGVDNIYDLGEARKRSGGDDDRYRTIVQGNALREVEQARFPSSPDKAKAQDQLDRLIRSEGSLGTEVAHRVLTTGSPAYRRFFNKLLVGGYATPEEQRAAALTGLGATTTTGGYATVYELDPTIMPTSNGAVNPYRRMSRVIQTNNNEWRGVTSAGVTAVYGGEASTAVEAGPTLAQPAAIVQKAQTQVSYSIEAGEDIADLAGQVGTMIADAKDVLEATQFTTGAGTTVYPQGICGVGSTTYYTTATTTVVAAADLYGVEAALPPRFRTKARWLANRFIYNKVRAIDTAGGAQLWTQNLTIGLPNRVDGNTGYNLLGYPADECSGMAGSVATTTLEAVFGDFDYFVIIDKIGMNIEVIPLVQASGYATGQRAIYAYWRNTSKCLNSASFIVMKGA